MSNTRSGTWSKETEQHSSRIQNTHAFHHVDPESDASIGWGACNWVCKRARERVDLSRLPCIPEPSGALPAPKITFDSIQTDWIRSAMHCNVPCKSYPFAHTSQRLRSCAALPPDMGYGCGIVPLRAPLRPRPSSLVSHLPLAPGPPMPQTTSEI